MSQWQKNKCLIKKRVGKLNKLNIVYDGDEDESEGDEEDQFIDPSQLSPEELQKLIEEHPEMAEQLLAAMGMEEGYDEDESEDYSEGDEMDEGDYSEYSDEDESEGELIHKGEPGQQMDQVTDFNKLNFL